MILTDEQRAQKIRELKAQLDQIQHRNELILQYLDTGFKSPELMQLTV